MRCAMDLGDLWTAASGLRSAELKVMARGPSIEIYLDGRLMMHQARYREADCGIGLLVDRADAAFEGVNLRTFA